MLELITDPEHTMLREPCAYCDVLPTFEDVAQMQKILIENRGVGLAANQVGLDSAFFIAEFSFGFELVINPQITSHGKEVVEKLEGCLSVLNPDGKPKFSPKRRWAIVNVGYQSPNGFEGRTLKRQDARIFQHEMDHLEGRLCHD